MYSIYMVDDHVMFREGLSVLLKANGHRVVGESADPTQAIAEIRQLAPEVLLLDLGLGNRSGFEVLSDVHRRALGTRTIIMTMSANPRHVAEALRFGAEGYVLKGSSFADLNKAITAVMKGDRHYVGEVAELAIQAFSLNDEPSAIASLSARERQVITLVVRGFSSARIGEALHLSPKTVDSYRSRLMSKVGVSDLTALVRFAMRTGLISADEL
jgi:two-component system invasion response regulator UvrY